MYNQCSEGLPKTENSEENVSGDVPNCGKCTTIQKKVFNNKYLLRYYQRVINQQQKFNRQQP